MFRFQFRRMLRCREFRAAVFLAMLVICGNLLRGAWSSHGMDASRILSAGEWYTGNGLSLGWSVFSAVWPFLGPPLSGRQKTHSRCRPCPVEAMGGSWSATSLWRDWAV